MKLSAARIGVGFVVCSVGASSGAGFFIPNQGARATARGNAFVATADDASAVYYNPAGLTQLLRPEAQAGVYGIRLGNEFSNGMGNFEADADFQPVPQIYFATPVTEQLAVGAGVNVPFGLSSDWGTGAGNPFPFVATESEFQYLSTYLVVSYEVTPTLSVGAGLTVNFADAELSRFDPISMGNLTLEGDAVTVGALFGVRWQPHEQHAFGAVFRTGSEFDLEGDATVSAFSFTGDANVEFDIPSTAAIGYSYRPTSRLSIEANVEWIDWDALNSYGINVNGAPSAYALAFDWESTFVYEIGASYELFDNFWVHAGYDYNEGTQPDLFYNPAVADADRHWLNCGVTQELENITWSAGYQFGWSDHTVTGSAIGTNGDYEARHHAIFADISYRF